MQTEWLSDADQTQADEAHDTCTREIDALTAEYKFACQRLARGRDRTEARILTRAAARLVLEVSSLQPLRDSTGVMIGFTFPGAKTPSPT